MKHFVSRSMVNLSRVDQEKNLDEILVEKAPTDCNAQKALVGTTVQIGVEEQEEEEVKPPFILIYLELYLLCVFFLNVSVVWLLVLMKEFTQSLH